MNYAGYIYMFIHICVFVIIIKESSWVWEWKGSCMRSFGGRRGMGKWYIYILSKPEIN